MKCINLSHADAGLQYRYILYADDTIEFVGSRKADRSACTPADHRPGSLAWPLLFRGTHASSCRRAHQRKRRWLITSRASLALELVQQATENRPGAILREDIAEQSVDEVGRKRKRGSQWTSCVSSPPFIRCRRPVPPEEQTARGSIALSKPDSYNLVRQDTRLSVPQGYSRFIEITVSSQARAGGYASVTEPHVRDPSQRAGTGARQAEAAGE